MKTFYTTEGGGGGGDSATKIWKFEYFRPRPFNIKTPILFFSEHAGRLNFAELETIDY